MRMPRLFDRAGRPKEPERLLPRFLGIGAPRSGTTWLHENLRAHPECFLPDRKELHFFDLRKDWRDLDRYARFFEDGRGRVRGEITPAYGHLPVERIRFLKENLPDLRLIYVLRNPVDRAWSSAVKGLLWRKDRRLEEVSEAEFLEKFQCEGSRNRCDYLANLRNWRSVFPEERILVRFHEEVRSDPEELLRSVFRHVGVSADVDLRGFPLREVVNATPKTDLPERYREFLVALYRDQIEELHLEFGDQVAGWRC